MRRLPLIVALFCLSLVVAGLALPRPSLRIESVVERNGVRTIRRHTFGPFLKVGEERLSSLDVSGDLSKELRRLGLKLPLSVAALLDTAERFYANRPTMTYGLQGEVSGAPKDVIDAFAR